MNKNNNETAHEVSVQEHLENLEISMNSKKAAELVSSYGTNHDKA